MDELLKVLDMPEDEQLNWLWTKGVLRFEKGTSRPMSLDVLAFRLRDEVMKNVEPLTLWGKATRQVFDYEYEVGEASKLTRTAWFVNCAQPIHWIIAALKAKQLAEEKT